MSRIDYTGETGFDESTNSRALANSIDIFDTSPHAFKQFDATPLRSAISRWSRLHDPKYGQLLDNTTATQPLSHCVTVDEPATKSFAIISGVSLNQRDRDNDQGETAVTGERSDVASANANSQQDNPAHPEQSRKGKRAAEARRRLELLEEERELQDNLAEFWDSRFDKPRRWRFPLASSRAQTNATPPQQTQENAVDSHEPTVGTKLY